ncbi:MAG: hypothetical protein V7K32_01595 [Nostoc sp.]|uniref:hypothetical protein n=1 Tax=Nostoc sp. TaxID=1180 RepID=UPI002FFB8CBD
MTKNNRKKTVSQAISTAVALGWVIMQVESAQAATLTVNNLNDSGVGSLRDTINMATSNDVVFLLGSHPSTINLTSGALAIPATGYAYAKNLTINGPGANLLTISSNNHFPVFDISAANVTFSGLAIAGNFNADNSSNLAFINSTVSGDNFKIDSNLRLINSTISSNNIEINANDVTLTDNSQLVSSDNIKINANDVTLTDHSQLVSSNNTEINASKLIIQDHSNIGTHNGITNNGTLSISTANLGLNNDGQINAGDNNNSGAGGSITVTASDAITITGSDVLPTRVPELSAIAGGSNHSGAGGEISITATTLILNPGSFISKPVPEPGAIAGGNINSIRGGNITLTIPDLLILKPVRKPSAIADDSNNSGLGGNITISAPNGFIISKPVPEPSAIAGSILACSLAWLAKRNFAAFHKAKA